MHDLGQSARQVEDEGEEAETAREELDGGRGAEDGRQAHQVDGAQHGAGHGAETADHHHGDDEQENVGSKVSVLNRSLAKARHTPA